MDLKGFKKVHEDGDKAIMEHPRGHQIVIAKKGLSHKLKKALTDLPLQKKDGGHIDDPTATQQAAADAASDDQPDAPSSSMQLPQLPNPQVSLPSQQSLDAAGGDAHFAAQDQAQANQPQLPPGVSAPPGFNEANKAIDIGQDIAATASAKEAALRKSRIAQELDSSNQYGLYRQGLLENVQSVTKDIADGHINPNQYIDSKDSLGKARLAIGVILGGFGAGLAGGPNMAIETINKQIDRNLEAQKADLGRKQNLLGALQKQYGDSFVAENMYKATLANTFIQEMDLQAAKSGSLKAQQAALQAKSQLMNQYMPAFNASASRLLVQNATGGQGQGQMDPAQLIPHLTDPQTGKPLSDEVKGKISAEVQQAQDAKNNKEKYLSLYDQASSDKSMMKHPLYATGAVTSPSIKAMAPIEDALIHDTEGRINEFEKADVERNRPQALDNEQTRAIKRNAMAAMFDRKASAPLAKAYGLDLQKFGSTSRNGGQYKPGTILDIKGKGKVIVGEDGNSYTPYKK